MSNDQKHLEWIYDRLIHVYSESPNVDYMLRFRGIIDGSGAPQPPAIRAALEQWRDLAQTDLLCSANPAETDWGAVVVAIAATRAALDEPEGEGPSERIIPIAKAVQEHAFGWEPDARLIGNVCAATPPAPEVGEVGEVGELVDWLTMLRNDSRGVATRYDDRLARIITLLSQQAAPAPAVVPAAERLRIVKRGIAVGYNLGHHHTVESSWGDPCEVADDYAEEVLQDLGNAPAPAVVAVAARRGWDDGFMAGVCVALATVTLHYGSVIWKEIVQSVGIDSLLNYAANVNPEDWDLAGFGKYAQAELGKDRPDPLPQVGEVEA
jgi:hypothetical protein